MKILIVIEDYLNQSNGMSISTQRFVSEFRKQGHEVKILAANMKGVDGFSLQVKKIPLFHPLIEKQGFHFAKADLEVMEEAVEWADLVHIEDPFSLCWRTAHIAEKIGKPVTGTFHLYPENMTASLPPLNHKLQNKTLMKVFRDVSYKSCRSIQCPTEKVKKRLEDYGFSAELRAISNGISEDYLVPLPKPAPRDFLQILSVGRYSHEKDQKTLIQAIGRSRHAGNIRLVLAGRGPLKEKYQELCRPLPQPALLKFCSSDELKQLMRESDLYVHTARVEVEGMACMEAFASGCVPIIADSNLSSTAIYALSPENRFSAGNAEELAQKIDYWIERPRERDAMSRRYQEYAQSLSLDRSAGKVLKMMEDACDPCAAPPDARQFIKDKKWVGKGC